MKKIKNKITNKFIKLKNKINNFIYKWIKKPYLDKKTAIAKEKKTKLIHKTFESTFGVSPKKINKLINKIEKKEPLFGFSVEKLETLRYKTSMSAPLLYSPEICDMHNENPDRILYPDYKQISRQDSDTVIKLLKEQSKPKSKPFNTRANFLWKTRS